MSKFHAGDPVVVAFEYENNGLGPLYGQTGKVLVPSRDPDFDNRVRLDPGHKWGCDDIYMSDKFLVSPEAWDARVDRDAALEENKSLRENRDSLAKEVRDRGTQIFDLQDELKEERAKYTRAQVIFNAKPELPDNSISLDAHTRSLAVVQARLEDERQYKKTANKRLSDFLDQLNAPLADGHSYEHVLSSQHNGDVYMVEVDGNGWAVRCTCKGFVFKETCKHLQEAERQFRLARNQSQFHAPHAAITITETSEFSPELLRAAATLLKAAQR